MYKTLWRYHLSNFPTPNPSKLRVGRLLWCLVAWRQLDIFAAAVLYACGISLTEWFKIKSVSLRQKHLLFCVKMQKRSIIINTAAATKAEKMRKWPPHKSHISLLSEMSLLQKWASCHLGFSHMVWNEKFRQFHFQLNEKFVFLSCQTAELLRDLILDAYFMVESKIPVFESLLTHLGSEWPYLFFSLSFGFHMCTTERNKIKMDIGMNEYNKKRVNRSVILVASWVRISSRRE